VRLLWLNWKDPGHPAAGGAEVVLWELSKRLVAEGHAVTVLTCGYDGSPRHEQVDGIEVIRVGNNRYAHSFQALSYYVRRLRNRFDIVVEVVNTAPYFSVFFGRRAKRFLFYHQLAGEIWNYETRPPLSHVGRYLLEPAANRLLANAGVPVITVSDSTRHNLKDFGFRPERTHIISEGIQLEPAGDPSTVGKYPRLTMLSLGAMRAMKRTIDQVKAFEYAKELLPDLQLKLAGSADDEYGSQVLAYAATSPYYQDIEYLGRVSARDKLRLMRRCHLITVTSIKEGWGLIVSEAASQGTPAVVYDVDGLRDSVRHGETGLVVAPDPSALAQAAAGLLADQPTYRRFQAAGWQWSKRLNFDQSYLDFKKVLEHA
jgi:glycosyltransferase involved in cell wall biosynthesis